MALKYGRASSTTTLGPKQGRTRYTEEQYNANVAAVEAEKSRKSAYDESLKKYDTDYANYYGKSTVDPKAAAAGASLVNMMGSKDSKGRTVTGEVAQGMTQAESDRIFDERKKKGEIISINDPSITAKTRELLKGAYGSMDISNSYFTKGKNLTKYADIYGEDFDPVQWRKDAKAGKLDKYPEGRSYGPVDGASVSIRGAAPVKPGAYAPNNIKPIDLKTDYVDFDWGKMKPLEVKLGEGKLRMPKKEKEKEELTWKAPMPVKKKGLNIGYTKIKPGGKTGIKGAAHPFDRNPVRKQMIKYNTEKRQSAAYFSGETSIGDKITGKTESELRDLKKETRGEGGRMLKEGRLGSAAKIGKDLGTIRKAIRYVKKGDISVGSVGEETGVTKEGQGSKLRYFTPEFTQAVQEDGKYTRGEGAMYGYQKYQAQEKDKAYRAQNENATNRNITWGRQQGASEGTAAPTSSFSSSVVTRGQMKDKFATDNPTASKKEIRQGVQKQVATNKQTLKDLREAEIKKGMY